MRTRIVFYSRSGTTRLMAEALAARLVAESSEITCAQYRPGLFGYIAAGRSAMRRERPEISVTEGDGKPDCLLIGSPIWVGRIAPPVRSYLAGLQSAPARVGVFLTSGGPPPHPKAQAEVAELLGRAPDSWLMLRGQDVLAGRHMDDSEDFLRDLTLHAGSTS